MYLRGTTILRMVGLFFFFTTIELIQLFMHAINLGVIPALLCTDTCFLLIPE